MNIKKNVKKAWVGSQQEKGSTGAFQRKPTVLRTNIEHKSKFTILKSVLIKTAQNLAEATIEALKEYTDSVLSITADNGTEFAYHEKISE